MLQKEDWVTDMVCAHSVNFLNLIAESHSLVRQQLDKLMRGRFPGEKLELLVDRPSPGDDDTGCNLYEA